jgi:prepilin-type N-terminal cleavage/methylation domain-containing protein
MGDSDAIIRMNFHFQQSGKGTPRKTQAAFTLIEILIAMFILGIVLSGLIYGYVQANWTAEWSSMSLAAQSYASQGAEQARAADWRPRDWPVAYGPGTMDELTNGSIIVNVDFMDIPTKGTPTSTNFQFWVTNIVYVTNISANPPLRQIRSDAIWTFPMNGTLCTNTVILLRTSDQ